MYFKLFIDIPDNYVGVAEYNLHYCDEQAYIYIDSDVACFDGYYWRNWMVGIYDKKWYVNYRSITFDYAINNFPKETKAIMAHILGRK